jgi:hypothetical protein
MTSEEVLASLGGDDEPKMAHVTYSDGTVEAVLIDCVDGEEFLCSGPDGVGPRDWWVRCAHVRKVERLNSSLGNP